MCPDQGPNPQPWHRRMTFVLAELPGQGPLIRHNIYFLALLSFKSIFFFFFSAHGYHPNWACLCTARENDHFSSLALRAYLSARIAGQVPVEGTPLPLVLKPAPLPDCVTQGGLTVDWGSGGPRDGPRCLRRSISVTVDELRSLL